MEEIGNFSSCLQNDSNYTILGRLKRSPKLFSVRLNFLMELYLRREKIDALSKLSESLNIQFGFVAPWCGYGSHVNRAPRRKTSAQPASAVSVQLQGNIQAAGARTACLKTGEMNVKTCLSPPVSD